MSHLFDSGFSVREPAWHQLTNVVGASPRSWNAARKAAGTDTWEVAEGPVFGFELAGIGGEKVFDPRAVILDEDTLRKLAQQVGGKIREGNIMDALEAMGVVVVEDKKRTLRTDTGATLGVPTVDYEVIGHSEMGEIIEALTKALSKSGDKARVVYDALVSLEGGKSIVATMYLDEPVTLPGDNSKTFPLLVVSTRNDGAGAARAQSTTIRVICANTRAASDNEADRNGTVFTFRHGASWRDRLEEARQTLLGLRKDFAENVEFLSTLARTKVTRDQELAWLEQFVPMPVTVAEVTDRQARTIEEARGTVMAILNSDTCSATRGKAISLLFAGDEFLDHYRGSNPTTNTRRTLLVPEKRKLRQVEIIRDVVGLAA
jgi:phage/plasmid-like protein (TIGR03299 family)